MEKEFTIRYRGKRVFVNLDDVIFIKVNRKECSFYLSRTFFPNVTITLKEVLEKIEEAGKGYEHNLMKVGKSHIINLKYVIQTNSKEGTVTLRRINNVPILIEDKKPVREQPEEIMKLVETIQKFKKDAPKNEDNEKQTDLYEDHVLEVGSKPALKLGIFLEEKKKQEVIGGYAVKKSLLVPVEKLNKDITQIDGHEYVDLNLPSGTLWAANNLGEYDKDCHSFYAWGELYESDSYDWDHYTAYPKGSNAKELDPAKDVVRKTWGGNWRMPTYKEFNELAKECTLIWSAKPQGCLVVGNNGNKIFLPAYGYKKRAERNELKGLQGSYWTCSGMRTDCGTSFHFKEEDLQKDGLGLHSNSKIERCYGLSIRPVMSKFKGNLSTDGTDSLPVDKKKTVLIINSYRFDLNSPFTSTPWNPEGWNVETISVLSTPRKMMEIYKEYCKKINPDVIVSVGSASFFCKQLKGYPRICLNPNYLPSDDLAERKELIKNQDIPQSLIDEYRKVEKNKLMARGKEKCVVVYGKPDDDEVYPTWDDPDFELWGRIDVDPWASPRNWRNTFLYPLMEKMI